MKAGDPIVELRTYQPQPLESAEEKQPIILESQVNPLSALSNNNSTVENTEDLDLGERKQNEEEEEDIQSTSNSSQNNNSDNNPSPLSMPQLTKMKIGVAIMVITTLLIILYYASDNIPFHLIEDACDWIKRNMLVGALLFIPVEIIWTVLCIPTTPIELAAGYAFGFGYGFLVDCIAKLIGAALSFFLGRYCLRKCATDDMFEGEKGKLFAAIDATLTNNKDSENSYESFKLLLLIQLAYIPVSIKNYGLSFTSVSFTSFITSALIGETPGTLAVTWTGSTTRDLVGLMSGEKSSSQTQIIVLILGLFCLVLCMVILGIRIKKKLDQTLNAEPYTPLPR